MRPMGDGWEWHDDWARLDEVPGADGAFAHHGLVVTAAGSVIGFHARQLVTFGPDGRVVARSDPGLFEGHQLTLVVDDGLERIWIADPGICLRAQPDGNVGHGLQLVGGPGRAVLASLTGEILRELPGPGHGGLHLPTSVAVDETRFGGSGDIWVADGYGSSLVHRYAADGSLIATLDGEEGAGRFNCPHAVFIDRRRVAPELYVADRGNSRVQVFDLDGRFVRSFGDGMLTSPSSFATYDDRMFIAELRARVAVLDSEDALIEYVGEHDGVADEPGWPNAFDQDGHAVRTPRLQPGRFNSPHAVAAGPDGSLYVAEWLLGGRYTKLTPKGTLS